jgi:hypothetical protein
MTALREIARVLQPTGVFGMIWNIDDCEYSNFALPLRDSFTADNAPKSWDIHAGWEEKTRDLIWTFDDDNPRFRHEKWKAIFDEQAAGNPLTLHFSDPLFSLPIGEGSVAFENWLSKEDIWKRLRTLSQLVVLEGDGLERVSNEYLDAINAEDTVTDEDGRVAVHGRTFFAWSTKIPPEPLKSGG